MDKQDAQILASFVWPKFFPKDKFMLQDKRIAAITMFCEFFKHEGKALLSKLDATKEKSLYFDVSGVSQLLPFPDFIDTLRTRPNEVIGCLGCAISILKTREFSSNLSEPFCIWPRFQNFSEDCSFSDLKSGTVGQLVNIRGYVVRVSPCKPLIEGVRRLF
jgi:DNA replicative helicase MCM subunit Mcm2 (Cdc46/Mcm family)